MLASKNAVPRSLYLIVPVILASICLALLLGGLRQTDGAMAAPNADVVTIGVAAALSHGQEAIGIRQANAVQLAVDQVNAAGGVDIGGTPYTVNLVMEDTECNPNIAREDAAPALVSAGVVAVVGDTCSGSTFAIHFAVVGITCITPIAPADETNVGR